MDQLDMTATSTTPGTETTFAVTLEGWGATQYNIDLSEELPPDAAPPAKGTDGSV